MVASLRLREVLWEFIKNKNNAWGSKWAYLDSNQGPQLYQSCALANWAIRPKCFDILGQESKSSIDDGILFPKLNDFQRISADLTATAASIISC